jgi:predicted outer membrane repeat protein
VQLGEGSDEDSGACPCVSITVAAALLAGCSGSQQLMGTPGAMPQMQANRQIVTEAKGLQSGSRAVHATWYVDGVHGDDGNNCKTKSTACATIGHAISLAASGDAIQIAAATYQENLSIPFNLTLNGAKPATTIVDGTNSSNVFTVGAGISLKLSNLTIEKGVGYSGGGGVDSAGTLTVNNSIFYLNTALTGGAILNTGMASISKTSFFGNSPYFFGHSASCGAIDNRGPMTIRTSTFDTNYANNNVTAGGAICNGATLTITNSTLSNNQSQGNNTGYGGGIYNYAGTLNVTNSTFSANSATTSGGAIYSNGGTVQISNSTFGNNPENIGSGGALSNAGSTVLIQDSIVANFANGGNCAGTVTSDGYNLSSDSTCNFGSQGDLNNTNPMLGALGKNGGPTQTMALQKGSPALDAGNTAGCRDFFGKLLKTDQRGKRRPGGSETTGCDMGAYESQTY